MHFWSNHFAVSADKQPLAAVAGLYEQEAIRPHVTGNFYDLLLAVERHPAMILYLDNQTSMGPARPPRRFVRRNRGRELGLNENLAREILELHTLGVDGGYTQADVTEFAKVLTGWSIGGTLGEARGPLARLVADPGRPGEFHFRAQMHEPGDKTIVGKRYRERGAEEGEDVLRALALHPSTARHLATKLARHFVADDPPPKLVERSRTPTRGTTASFRASTRRCSTRTKAGASRSRSSRRRTTSRSRRTARSASCRRTCNP